MKEFEYFPRARARCSLGAARELPSQLPDSTTVLRFRRSRFIKTIRPRTRTNLLSSSRSPRSEAPRESTNCCRFLHFHHRLPSAASRIIISRHGTRDSRRTKLLLVTIAAAKKEVYIVARPSKRHVERKFPLNRYGHFFSRLRTVNITIYIYIYSP